MGIREEFNPDYTVSPWETALDAIKYMRDKDQPISDKMADCLEGLSGTPARFWKALESNHRRRLETLKAVSDAAFEG